MGIIVNFLLSSHYICQIPASYTSPASNISKRPITPGLYSACYFKIGTQKWRTCSEVQLQVLMKFGDTEIMATAVDLSSGNAVSASVDFFTDRNPKYCTKL